MNRLKTTTGITEKPANPLFARRGTYQIKSETDPTKWGGTVNNGVFEGNVMEDADGNTKAGKFLISINLSKSDVRSLKIQGLLESSGSDENVNLQFDTSADYYQAFAMDGREALPNDDPTRRTNENPTATAPQQAAFTLCLVCHGSQEFTTQPTVSSQITADCWNPSRQGFSEQNIKYHFSILFKIISHSFRILHKQLKTYPFISTSFDELTFHPDSMIIELKKCIFICNR